MNETGMRIRMLNTGNVKKSKMCFFLQCKGFRDRIKIVQWESILKSLEMQFGCNFCVKLELTYWWLNQDGFVTKE